MRTSHYIKAVVYGANDGIVTTFAVIAGITGAGLPVRAILILGFASLFADGFSMASSNYLGERSQQAALAMEGEKSFVGVRNPLVSAIMTLVSFVVAGSVPLLPFVFSGAEVFIGYSLVATFVALFVVGSLRTLFTGRHMLVGGFEMLLVGGIAASIAYLAGTFISLIV